MDDIIEVVGGLSKRCPISFMLMSEETAIVGTTCTHPQPFHRACLQQFQTCPICQKSLDTLIIPIKWLTLYRLTPPSEEVLCNDSAPPENTNVSSILIDLTNLPDETLLTDKLVSYKRPLGCKHLNPDSRYFRSRAYTFSSEISFINHLAVCWKLSFKSTPGWNACPLCQSTLLLENSALITHLFSDHDEWIDVFGAYKRQS